MRSIWEGFLRSPGAGGKGEEVGPGVSDSLPPCSTDLLRFFPLKMEERARKSSSRRDES